MLFSESETHKFELLENGAYGWAQKWSMAMTFANAATETLNKRHRVYWSPNGKVWMVRRAFNLSGAMLGPTIGVSQPAAR
jgi:hypothetical protein